MILKVLSILAMGVGLSGALYFFIKNGKEITKSIEKEIKKARK